jgi:hypothetical protein
MGAVRAPMIAVAWMCATAAAVGVSWLGVRTVVHDAVMKPVQVQLPASVVPTGTPPPTEHMTAILPTSTTSVRPTTTTPPATTTTSSPVATTTTTAPATTTDANVHRYAVKGGEVVLSMTSTQATLVSATPADGYSVQAWQETGWLRVDFTSGNATSSVFATWNGHPPSVQTYEQ